MFYVLLEYVPVASHPIPSHSLVFFSLFFFLSATFSLLSFCVVERKEIYVVCSLLLCALGVSQMCHAANCDEHDGVKGQTQ